MFEHTPNKSSLVDSLSTSHITSRSSNRWIPRLRRKADYCRRSLCQSSPSSLFQSLEGAGSNRANIRSQSLASLNVFIGIMVHSVSSMRFPSHIVEPRCSLGALLSAGGGLVYPNFLPECRQGDGRSIAFFLILRINQSYRNEHVFKQFNRISNFFRIVFHVDRKLISDSVKE